MFSQTVATVQNQLIQTRLARVLPQIKTLQLTTREDYLAQVTSLINSVLNTGNHMQKLKPVIQGPATVGDITGNLGILNQDAIDLVGVLGALTDNTFQLANLAATSEQSLVQQMRESLFACTPTRFIEAFVSSDSIAQASAEIDYAAGVAALSLQSETTLKPTIALGASCVGSLDPNNGLANLTDGQPNTAMCFNGSRLELVLSFPGPQAINRLRLQLDDYDGWEITEFTSSSDMISSNDILDSMQVDSVSLDATSGKYSGIAVIDFPAVMAQQLKLVIEDRSQAGLISLRELAATCRRYSDSATLQTNMQTAPTGLVNFTVDACAPQGLTSIMHQISSDGVNFLTIQPGEITLPSPWCYRAVLARNSDSFKNNTLNSPFSGLTPDPNYQIGQVSSLPLGSGVIQRTVQFTRISGPVALQETPVPGSVRVLTGAVALRLGSDYAFRSNVLSFASSITGVTLTYQVAPGSNLSQLVNYYSPYLYQMRFDRI